MKNSPSIEDKAAAILSGALKREFSDGQKEEFVLLATAEKMASALALLTSPVKAEREEGKRQVRLWRHSELISENLAAAPKGV